MLDSWFLHISGTCLSGLPLAKFGNSLFEDSFAVAVQDGEGISVRLRDAAFTSSTRNLLYVVGTVPSNGRNVLRQTPLLLPRTREVERKPLPRRRPLAKGGRFIMVLYRPRLIVLFTREYYSRSVKV